MSSVFRPSTREDEARLIEFLSRVFAATPDAPFVEPALVRWKYWEPRGDFAAPRSFVMEKEGRLVAHVAIWPVTVQSGVKRETGVHMIDWASDPDAPGAGVSLLQRLTKSYDFVYSIGGSEMTQRILPKFGFRNIGDAVTWARPLRPWRQMLRHQSRNARLAVRFARNFWWSKVPGGGGERGWTAVRLQDGDPALDLAGERDAAFFSYLRTCPAADCLTFALQKEGRNAGFLALADVGDQARLAGAWLENPSPENWRTVFQLTQEATLQHTGASELIARSAAPECIAAAELAGMRQREQVPVFLFRKATAVEPFSLQFQLADNDAFFHRSPSSIFLT